MHCSWPQVNVYDLTHSKCYTAIVSGTPVDALFDIAVDPIVCCSDGRFFAGFLQYGHSNFLRPGKDANWYVSSGRICLPCIARAQARDAPRPGRGRRIANPPH